MTEAMDQDLILGVCTTSNEKAAHTVAYQILKDIQFNFVLAGDIVSKKKPDPEIYLMALKKTGLKPEECIVVEDSRNGVLAAKAAGVHVVATTNVYTEKENLSQADIIVTCLGEPDGEKGTLKQGGQGLDFDGVLRVDQLIRYFSSAG
jgi:beta-phosphoglucomutase-like phosphatase (HAD superfamily)